MPQRSVRQAIEAMPRIRRQQTPSTTVDTYVQNPAPSQQKTNSQRVVGALTDIAGVGAKMYQTYNREKVEMDKVTQQQRALQGLDPTDDATDAGIRAYQVINMRDQVMDANASLAEEVRKNPEMTDEEYELASREAYAGLFTQYKPDTQLSAALSNKVQESQTQIHQIRSSVQREHREWKSQETFKKSAEAYREASDSPDELADMITEGGQLSNEASALGVPEEAQRTMLVKMAQSDAANGDSRMFRALKKQEWASRDPRIQKAEQVYQQWSSQENASEIGRQWGEIQMGWEQRSASWSQTQSAIEQLNNKFPGSVTANQVASLRKRGAAVHAKEKARAELLSRIEQATTGEQRLQIGTDPRFTKGDRDDIIDMKNEHWRTVAEQRQASGEWDAQQAQEFILRSQIKFGRSQAIEVPGVKDTLSNLTATNPSDWDTEGVPSEASAGLSAIGMMSPSDIDRYGKTEDEKTMFRNYQRFLSQDMPDRQAWVRAHRSVVNRESLDAEVRDELIEDSVDEANDIMNQGGWLWSSQDEVPDGQRLRIRQEVQTEALSMVDSGATDVDDVGGEAARRVMSRYTRLDNGSLINATEQELASASRYEDEEGVVQTLAPQNRTQAFEMFFNDNFDNLAAESSYGEDLEMDQVQFIYNQNGLIEVQDTRGDVLTDRPINLRNLTKDYNQRTSTNRARSALDRALRDARNTRNVPALPGGL